MEIKHSAASSGETSVNSSNLALQLARQQLSRVADIEGLCRKSGAQCFSAGTGKSITVRYLNRTCIVGLTGGGISLEGENTAVGIKDMILILHYLLSARGTPPTRRLISFQELPEGAVYYPTFIKRAVQPLIAGFGSDPRQLTKMGLEFGGCEVSYGDAAVTVNAFPFLSVTIVLWRGDGEFPPNGNMLFDANIPDYLPTEDITVLCETIAWRIVKSRQSQ